MSLTLPVQAFVDRSDPPELYWPGPDLPDLKMPGGVDVTSRRKAWIAHGLMPADPGPFPPSINPRSRACQVFAGCGRAGRYY